MRQTTMTSHNLMMRFVLFALCAAFIAMAVPTRSMAASGETPQQQTTPEQTTPTQQPTPTQNTNNAKGANFSNVVAPVVALLNSLVGPALLLVGAAGTLYCILLGVKFAKAEEPQEREKAKAHLKNAIIGFFLIFILILVLNLSMDPMIKWVNDNGGSISISK